jgi:predicted CXXCH cytochrome family protein
MKKLLLLFIGLTLLIAQGAYSQKFNYGSTMGVTGHHNFKTSTWNPSGEVCVVCHTPHNAYLTEPSTVIWNHQVTSQTFTLYSSASMKATLGQPDGNSKLCLSCHDGITAEDNFNGITTGTRHFSATSSLNIGSDNRWGITNNGLANDHPISFTYDATLASLDNDVYDPTVKLSGLPGSSGTIAQDLLFDGKMQCCTCHDPHNNTSPTSTQRLLRNSNTGSAFCLTCHKF